MQSPQVQCALSPPRSQPQFPRTPVWCALCLFWGARLQLQPSWRMSTIQNLRKSLIRDWKPVCSLVEDALSGLSLPLSPPLCLLPPVGDGLVYSQLALLWNCSIFPLSWERISSVFISVFCRLIFSLSLLLSYSLSCYLMLAPSDCPQGIQAGPYPKQCHPLPSVQLPLAGGRCEGLGYFSAGSCFQACNLSVLFIFPPGQVAL